MKIPVKIVVINVATFVALITGVEFFSYLLLSSKGIDSGFLYKFLQEKDDAIKDPCQIMTTHPFMGFTHKTKKSCEIKNGKDIGGGYILYNGYNKSNKVLVTYGGSTTDGFFKHINNGITWSMLLNKLLLQNSPGMTVINGGNGGYSSQSEVLKFLLTKSVLKKDYNISAVVSLNGINDMPGYNIDTKLQGVLPYWNRYQLKSIRHEKFINVDSDAESPYLFFPAINRLLRVFQERSGTKLEAGLLHPYTTKSDESEDISINNINSSKLSAIQWSENVRNLNALAAADNIKYYVFLQPTMGISSLQIPSKKNSSDGIIYSKLSTDYIKKISELYSYLKTECSKLNFCFDISDEVVPSGNMYSDARHHNEYGNSRIAKLIYKKLSEVNVIK